MYSSAASGILAEAYILLVLSFVLIIVRAYVRLRITAKNAQGWKWDDTTIVIAWIFLLIGVIIIQLKVDLGLGRHIHDIPNAAETTPLIRAYNIFFEMNCVVVTMITKISISIYILRIRDDKPLRWILWIMMTLMSLATIATIAVLGSACTPLKKMWEPHTPGSCLDLAALYNVAYVQSALTIVTDLGLSFVPIYILWNIRIATSRKIYVCSLFSMGLIATISNAMRNAYTHTLTSKDFTYDQVPITVIAYLEMGIGIIAACVPTCVGIFRYKKHNTQPSSGYSISTDPKGSKHTGSRDPYALSTIKSYNSLKSEDGVDLYPTTSRQGLSQMVHGQTMRLPTR